MDDIPFYFPLSGGYSVGQAAPLPLADDQYGNGVLDGCVFQLAGDSDHVLRCKRDVVRDFGARHVGRDRLSDAAHAAVTGSIIDRLTREYPERFTSDALAGLTFEELAMLVPEDLAITCVGQDDDGRIAGDWLAAVHVCMPSGWDPADRLGGSFAQIHRTVQVAQAKRFLLEGGRVKDYVDQMMRCTAPHVRFIWTLQVGDARNRNPQTRDPAAALKVDPTTGASNIFFRVERQTITSFPDADASLFTIRTYLYPLAVVVAEPTRREQLKLAVAAMPVRVLAYKGWSAALLDYINEL